MLGKRYCLKCLQRLQRSERSFMTYAHFVTHQKKKRDLQRHFLLLDWTVFFLLRGYSNFIEPYFFKKHAQILETIALALAIQLGAHTTKIVYAICHLYGMKYGLWMNRGSQDAHPRALHQRPVSTATCSLYIRRPT